MQLAHHSASQVGVSVPREDHHLGHTQFLPTLGKPDKQKAVQKRELEAFVLNSFLRYGRGGWIRTNAWQDQNLLPYRLATPLYLLHECLALGSF
jgi:hypothetical protein